MTGDWQTWMALGVVAIAAGLLVRGALRGRGRRGDCSCPVQDREELMKRLRGRKREEECRKQ